MEKIIDAVDVALIKQELTPETLLCESNKGGNLIHVVDAHNAPNTMREIGRLREIAFRAAGSGSGQSCDIDRFDTMELPYQQMVVWDPDADRIIGGYRFILGRDVKLREDGQPDITMAHLFHFSDSFVRNYLPHAVELGRSFVVPEYQSSSAGAKAIFALDNLFDGLGAIMMKYQSLMYFFGKMTMPAAYDGSARDLIHYFVDKHFPDSEMLARPYKPVLPVTDTRLLEMILDEEAMKDDFRKLKTAVRRLDTGIPPLINSYINLSPTMKSFGTATNDEFAEAYETGILISWNEMSTDKRERHMMKFLERTVEGLRRRFPGLTSDVPGRLAVRWEERRLRSNSKKRNKK